MIPDSRLLSFMTHDECYAVHIIEGQKIIKDLALIHDLKGAGFLFYRDCVLSAIPLISLLKHGETLGFYIDSKEPTFAFKIEMSEHGHLRTLLMPESFDEFPKKVTGTSRLIKIMKNKAPYNSIIELKDIDPHKISNQMIKESYQMDGFVILSQDSDQAALIMKLPRKSWDKEELLPTTTPFESFKKDFESLLPTILAEGKHSEKEIINTMEKNSFFHLKSKDIAFKCSCTRERMILGLKSLLGQHSVDELFEGENSLETKCDYCKTFYQINKNEVK